MFTNNLLGKVILGKFARLGHADKVSLFSKTSVITSTFLQLIVHPPNK